MKNLSNILKNEEQKSIGMVIFELIIACVVVVVFVAAILAALAYFIGSCGFVLSMLWAWFVLPVFPFLPALSFVQATGVFLFVDFLLIKVALCSNILEMSMDKETGKPSSCFVSFIKMASPWVALLVGYLFKTWFM